MLPKFEISPVLLICILNYEIFTVCLTETLNKYVSQALLVNKGIDGQCEEKIGVNLNERDGLTFIIHKGLKFGEDELPHFREVDVLEGKEVLPHPTNYLHLAIVPPVEEFEYLHLTLQVVIDYWEGNLPFADLTTW